MCGLYVLILKSWEGMRACHTCVHAATATEARQGEARCGMAWSTWPYLSWHDVVRGVDWFCRLSQLMIGVSEGTAHDDATYESLILRVSSIFIFFHLHLLIFRTEKPRRLICSASERLLVFYGSGWDKRLIPASIQYSCANIPPHSFCCNQSSPRLGSCVHRNTESRPSKPSRLCVHLLRWRATIRFLGSTPTTISYTSWGWL